MSIKIYQEYDELSYSEKDICEYFQDLSLIKDNYDSFDDELDFNDIEYKVNSFELNEDGNFYIVSDDEDEEIAEDIASYLGRYKKINLKEFHKIFFYLK